jgi:hypothetical protein
MPERLHSCVKARSNKNALSAQRERCGKPAPIGNAARGYHYCFWCAARHQIDNGRDQRKGGAPATVPPSFGTLGDDDLRAGVERLEHMIAALNLTDKQRPGRVDTRSEWPWIAE